MVGWIRILLQKRKRNSDKKAFTIVVPYRNEEINIKKLVSSLNEISYSSDLLEVIFVNDHSEDHSEEYLIGELEDFNFQYKMLSLEEEQLGKKKALNKGISKASKEYIITTDADCHISKDWVNEINAAFQPGVEFVIGSVINISKSGVFDAIQEIESIMLAGITLGTSANKTPMLCSGANLAFSKGTYNRLKPYDDNYNIPSGDDMFFLEKIKKENLKVISYSDGISVTTNGPESIKELVSRSARWAKKSVQLKSYSATFFGLIVLIINCSLLILALTSFFYHESIDIFLKLCTFKFILDMLLFIIVASHYKRINKVIYIPFMVVFYPIYLTIITVVMLLIKLKWKNRSYSVG